MRQNSINLPDGYGTLLQDLKERIQNAQLKAAVAVNRELILLYWDLGARIIARQNAEGWGTKVIDRLAGDLHAAFPSRKGLSGRFEVYAGFRASLAGRFNCAGGACTVALASPYFCGYTYIIRVKSTIWP